MLIDVPQDSRTQIHFASTSGELLDEFTISPAPEVDDRHRVLHIFTTSNEYADLDWRRDVLALEYQPEGVRRGTDAAAAAAFADQRLAAAQRFLASHEPARASSSFSLPCQRWSPRCWNGRIRWLAEVEAILRTAEGQSRLRARARIDTALAVAAAMADFADYRTGRYVSASLATIGLRAARYGRGRPLSASTVSKVRCEILAPLGLAQEHVRGRYLTVAERLAATLLHGGNQVKAASTWSLQSPDANEIYDLSRRGNSRNLFPQKIAHSPSALKRAAPSGRNQRQQRVSAPRPCGAQAHRVAAEFVQHATVYDRGQQHLGAIVRVIDDLVDCTRWTGKELVQLIDQDTAKRGWSSPTRIYNPAGFLRRRLRELADHLAGPTPREQADARKQEAIAAQTALREAHRHAAERARHSTPESRAAILAEGRKRYALRRRTGASAYQAALRRAREEITRLR